MNVLRPIALLPLLALLACGEAPPSVFPMVVRVESDPGVPLVGAEVLRDATRAATTDAKGIAGVTLTGAEGDSVMLRVQCPPGHESPPALSVRLRRAADGKPPEETLFCPPRARNVVIAIRATNGEDLPVMHLGRVIARTDSFGVAHALVVAQPGETIDLTLDTSARPRLRPQNPSASYSVRAKDDAFVIDQKFVEERPPAPIARKPSVPKRLSPN